MIEYGEIEHLLQLECQFDTIKYHTVYKLKYIEDYG